MMQTSSRCLLSLSRAKGQMPPSIRSTQPAKGTECKLAQLGRRVTAKGAKMGDHLLVAAATRQCRRAATYIGNARQVQEGLPSDDINVL